MGGRRGGRSGRSSRSRGSYGMGDCSHATREELDGNTFPIGVDAALQGSTSKPSPIWTRRRHGPVVGSQQPHIVEVISRRIFSAENDRVRVRAPRGANEAGWIRQRRSTFAWRRDGGCRPRASWVARRQHTCPRGCAEIEDVLRGSRSCTIREDDKNNNELLLPSVVRHYRSIEKCRRYQEVQMPGWRTTRRRCCDWKRQQHRDEGQHKVQRKEACRWTRRLRLHSV